MARVNFYNTTYGGMADPVYGEVRREAYGEDIGQSSWLTADEFRKFFAWLQIAKDSRVLEVGSGSGVPALFMAEATGCRVTGVDINENGIAAAQKAAAERHLDERASFEKVDAGARLPFPDFSFDAIVSIDAMCHIPERQEVLKEWRRVLRPGGRALYTDPIVVTGILTGEEVVRRSSIGYFLFVPPGENERIIAEAGLELVRAEDVTQNTAETSRRWCDARAARSKALREIEGDETFEGTQLFLETVWKVSSERRLSRFAFLVEKPA